MLKWLKHTFGSFSGIPDSTAAARKNENPAADGPADEGAQHKGRGDGFYKQSEFGRAEECYRQAIAANPQYAEAYNVLGNVLNFQGRHPEAVAAYQRAIALKPDLPGPHNNLGNLYQSHGNLDEAIACYRKTLALNPDFAAEVHTNLGNALYRQGKLADAVICYETAIALNPEYAGAYTNLGIACSYLGRVEKALESYRIAISLDPNDVDAHSNLLFIMQYFENLSPSEVFAQHLRFAQRFEAPLKSGWLPHANSPDPQKRLKIGYVSPDFRSHSVAYFIEPILESHDKSQVEVFCYHNHAQHDNFTDRIKRSADHWVPCVGASDQALAEKIRADGIDILVDLAGHTSHNRILTFARKPAPVQVTYLGYQNTTGLAAMDYRLTDRYADPADMTGQFHVEQLWHLPAASWCYRPNDNSPAAIEHLPMEGAGYVTFGCLNNFSKVTDRVLSIWAKVLKRAPSSRLLLKVKGIENAGDQAEVKSRLARLGIPADRLILIGHQKEHPYALYNRIDLALDPFPYNGCTSSFDSLWMGVPFVTLAGQSSVSRVGVSILTNAGLSELIAHSEDEYVDIAAALALDPVRLRSMRAGLHNRMKQGPLMDARGMASNFEQVYRDMWKKWCSSRIAATPSHGIV